MINGKHSVNNESGYSMIEIVIAIAIFAIGALSVARMQLSVVQNNTSGNVLTQATMLVQDQMELLKNAGLSSTALEEGANKQDPNNPVDQYGNSGGIFTRTWTIEKPAESYRKITVTVTWDIVQSGRGRVQMASITQGNGI